MVVKDLPLHPKVDHLSPAAANDRNWLRQSMKYLKSYQLPNGYQSLNNCLAGSSSVAPHHPKVDVPSLVGASKRKTWW